MIGKTLSHYRVLEQIGAGGMGVVYRARDERLERDVALKVLAPGVLSDAATRSRFRREALALSRLNHPHIGVIHDFDTVEDTDFLVMEYVSGATLGARIAEGPLPIPEAVRIAREIAEALEEAHERGTVHRDLKPENVVITPKGWVKVLDFGLAKLLEPAGVTSRTLSMSAGDLGAGTLPYMAPEQLLGRPSDARTDLFALGAVLYEMTTGARPFAARLSTALVNEILTRVPARPRSVRPDIPPRLDAIVMKALEKDPTHRYQTAQAFASDLKAFAEDPSARGGAPSAERRVESLAVLPLENLSGDPEQEYFADGMTEELIANLAQIGALRVISRTSVMRYKGARKPLPEIARELNVDAIVEGSVRRAGERVRITAQLLDAATDRHLWAKSYERDLRDVLALQGEVAQAIAQEIQVKLTLPEQAKLKSVRLVAPEAYEAFLKGRYHMNKRSEDGLKRGVAYFQEAVEHDASYPLTYVGLADSYNLLGYYSLVAPRETFPRAKAAASRALEIAPDLAEAHTSLGYVALYYDWDWSGADAAFRRALELKDSYPVAHLWYGNLLAARGDLDGTLREFRRTVELDPLSLAGNTAVGWAHYYAGRYEEADAQYRRALELDPGFLPRHVWQGWALQAMGKGSEAIAQFEQVCRAGGLTVMGNTGLAWAHALQGHREKALELLDSLVAQSKERYVDAYYFVLIHTALGDHGAALDCLDRAYDERSHWIALLGVDPKVDALRKEPRFRDLLQRVGIKTR